MSQQTMYEGIANSPSTQLSIAINESDTIITVVDSMVFPSAPNLLVIGYDKINPETCLYTNINGNQITIQRATEGIAQSFEIGTKISRLFTAKDYNTMVNNIRDLNNKQVAISIALG